MEKSKDVNRRRGMRREAEAGRPVVMRYYARKLCNDDFIREFVVTNPTGPMRVESMAPGGQPQEWPWRDADGIRVFTPPDGYTGGPILWAHDISLVVEPMVYESTKVM